MLRCHLVPGAGRAALLVLAWLSAASLPAYAAEDQVDFSHDVYPLLQRSCIECHGADKQEGGLRLDSRAAVRDSWTIVPGSAKESELVRRIGLPAGHREVMPAVGEPLSGREIATLSRWIEMGAAWPEDFQPPKHWSYIPPQRPVPPQVMDDRWIQSPIDRFVLARLEQEGLRPSPRAAPEKLIRRIYLDVIGLPPTPEEVDAFVADPSDQRLERIVDDLLARPQYGEQWARPWLDLARYADSHGFQRDDLRDVWPYRDWVIRAINDDMPFDQFTIEQIAGDLLPDATESQRIATGFHRCTPTNVEAGSLPEETRIEQVLDRVNTTAAVWLGTTMECCQCHDHKYDPFSMRDYYGMLAFFNSTEREADRANPQNPSSIQFQGPSLQLSNPERELKRQELTRQKAELQKSRSQHLDKIADRLPENLLEEAAKRDIKLPKQVVAAIKKGPDQLSKQQRQQVVDLFAAQDTEFQKLEKQLAKVDRELNQNAPDTSLVMIELAQPRPTHIFERGDYRNPGQQVTPATPSILHAMPEGPANRLTLGRWLVSRENPLVARVVVNRWWSQLFGAGLVGTEEDFGIKGERPSHPELLDYLAVQWMDHGWSRKYLLKQIILSATYQQSSVLTPELRERDDQNRLLARGPRFRMSAEMIRDNALAVSGLLSLKQFGPPIRPYQPPGLWTKLGGKSYKYEVSPGSEQYRRGIYVVLKRTAPYPSFTNFDATARLSCTIKRSRTNTPLQALTLLNDPVYVSAATALAKRIRHDQAEQPLETQLAYGFQLCTARQPDAAELSALRNLYQQQSEQHDADQAWVAVGTVLLNLHETITKD